MRGKTGQPAPSFFKGKSILVTGGAGYLASGLINLLKNVDCRIFRLLHRKHAPQSLLGSRAQIIDQNGDMLDSTLWEKHLKGTDIVFHFAAQTSAYAANENPIADQAANVQPMIHILETCRRQQWHPIICFASTVTIVGIAKRLPVDESHPDHPPTIYDLHKQMAEQYLRWYAEQGLVQGVTLRLANVYGPGPGSSHSDRGVLNQMMHRALAGQNLTVYGAGDQLRDYLYIEDAARAFLAAAQYSETLNGKYFVIGSGQGHTIAEAMALIAERAGAKSGIPVMVDHVAPPKNLLPIEQRHFIANSSQFSRATGWQAQHPFAQGIELTLEAFA